MARTNSTSDKAFQIHNASRTFNRTKALNKISVEAGWGLTIGLFGPNGAGKSTFLKVLAGISTPDNGSVKIAGLDLKKHRARSNRIIGYVGHLPMLYQNLTIAENLHFLSKMYGISNAHGQIEKLLEQFAIYEFRNQRVYTLSNGIQKRATIARSLIHRPSLLLLDEPETGLDKNGVDLLDQAVKNVCKSGSTVVMSTHDLERGLALSSDVLVIKTGKIIHQSPANQITNPDLRTLLN